MTTHYGNHNSQADYKKILLGVNREGNSLTDFIEQHKIDTSHHKELTSQVEELYDKLSSTEQSELAQISADNKFSMSIPIIINGACNSELFDIVKRAEKIGAFNSLRYFLKHF